ALTSTFTNGSTNATSYEWDFGDGNTSTEENPTHTYADGGAYTVVLTATNDCGSVTFFENISFAQLPVADFGSNVTSGCGPLSVEFMDFTTGVPTSWNWSFPGGTPSTSTDQNPTVVYDAPGTYNVTLVSSNASGTSTSTQTAYVEVLAGPTADFTSDIDILVVDFNNTSTNAFSYEWDFGDGSSSMGESPIHIYAADGTYTVTLTAMNLCDTITTTQEITVVSLPVVGFAANATQGCAPFAVAFEDQSSANVTGWSWSFPGGTPANSTEQNPTITYDTPGTYDVTLVGTNVSGSATFTQTSFVVVGDTPDVSFGTSVSSLTAEFSNTSTNALSYFWDFGDGNTSVEENPMHEYAANGTYTVTLTAANACGSVTTTEMITVQYSGSAPSAAFTSNVTTGCIPFTVNFEDQSSGDATAWEWSFPGGSPVSSTEQNPTITYNTPGTYDVMLIVSNPGGSNTASQTSMIIVGDEPTSEFNATLNGDIVSLMNTSTGATTYDWDFGDGNTSTEENPTHTYDTDGTYIITLTATNDCGSVTTTETITVVTAPSVAFTADVLSGCTPLTVNFTDQSTGTVDSWLWEIPGATPASSVDQNPAFTFDTPGTYDVTLTVTNASGNYPLVQTSMIVVETVPTAGFDVDESGGVYSFTNNSTGANSYSWDFGDGSLPSTDMNPTHTYTTDGTYTVTLTATNDCGSVTTTKTITFTTAPTVAFIADVISGCAPLTVNFTDQSVGTVNSWLWEIPGATPVSSADQNPTFTFDTPGTYDVTLTVTNTTGSYPLTQTAMIVVGDVPTAAFDVMQSGSVYSFTNNSTNGDTYLWDFGDGSMTSAAMNPTHSYALNGTYTVQLITTNDCGSDTTTFELMAEAAPMAAFSADTTFGCVPLTVQFSDLSLNATAWDWAFAGGNPATSTDQNPAVTYDTPGTYEVSLTASNSTGADNVTLTSYIVVGEAPTAEFFFNADTTSVEFLNSSVGGVNATYLWEFGDGETSDEEEPTHMYDGSGTYTVTLTVTNDCGTATFENTIVLTTSIAEVTFLDEFSLFPNPNNGQFTIVLKGQPKDELRLNLINVIGQYIHREIVDFSSGQMVKQMNFNLPVGTYIVELQSESEVIYKKVVIE
ncbi:MAG: PKD domain-containing protein, partial [Bacteroidota bacterium]